MRDLHLLPLFVFGTLLVSGFAVAVIFSLVIQKQRQVKNRLARQRMEFDYSQSLLNTRIEVQETTLNMVAQELHDNVAQVLTGCFMQLANASSVTEDMMSKSFMDEAKENIKDVIRDVRLLSHSLATGMVEKRDLQDAIQAELTRIETFGNIRTRLRSETIYEFGPEQRLFLFRIVQEALQNILKHAKARSIIVTMSDTGNYYILQIVDDGQGFDPVSVEEGKSMGLVSMRERVALLKGSIKMTSAPGDGTSLEIVVPINPKNAQDQDRHSR